MYLCSVRVRHYSSHGPTYVKNHIVKVTDTLEAAVVKCGAQPPTNETASLIMHEGRLPEIVYTDDTLPISIDPPHFILTLHDLQGGVFIHIPYKCSFFQLVSQIIPDKLSHIGVHAHYVHGILENAEGNAVRADSLWTGTVPHILRWSKLRVPVAYSWPRYVIHAIQTVQRRFRRQHELDCQWVVLHNNIE